MCKLLEEMRSEAAAEATAAAKAENAASTALKLLARGRDSVEEIAELTGLTLEEVRELAKRETA